MERPDGLPHPVTPGEAFQAAILEEIRGLRADLKKFNPEPTNENKELGSHIKEPHMPTSRKKQ